MKMLMRLSLILLIWLSYTVGSQVVKSSNGRRLSKTTSVSTRRHHKGARPGSRQYANVQKLPKSLKPIAYDIKLNSLDDLSNEQLRLNAEVTIGLRAVQSTNVITFHLDLNVCRITGAKIQGPSDPFPKALSTQYLQDYQNNVVSYNVPSQLVQQLNYNLTLAYNCFVNSYESDQVGLYFYYAGADRYLVTNDEPFYAREWLPCWDEPEYKAKFRFLISSKLLQPGQIALTNGVYEGTNSDGFLQFSSTPPISSYLVAFTTGKYTSIQRSSSGGVSVTAWYPPRNNQASLMAGYYAAAAVRQLDMMTDYTGLKFNGPKLDVLFTAMSDDGMENWGLITQNIDTTSKEQLEFTAYHEVVHQWFGNLVTAIDWSDIWLHEGFANFFQYRLLKSSKSFYYTSNMKAEKKRAISIEDGKQSLVDKFYANSDDWSLAYSKGNAILNMLETVMSEFVLQQGLRTFLQRYQYGTVNTAQLLSTLDETAKQYNIKGWTNAPLNVTEFLTNYLYKPGYPTVTIQSDYTTGSVVITQNFRGQWYVPIWFQSTWNSQSPLKTYWLTPTSPLTIGWNEGIQLPASQITWDPYQAGYYAIYVPT